MDCNSTEGNVDTLGAIKKFVGLIKWLYSRVKPATLEYLRRDIRIYENHLEYAFTYRFKKGKWSLWVSKKDISIPVGNDVEVVYPEILLPAGLGSKKVKVRELKARIHEILSPHFANINNGEKLQITILMPFDTTKFIEKETVKTTPEEQEIIFENLLPYRIEQHEISLDIPEPYPIKNIRIEKKDRDVGADRCLTLETQSTQRLVVSDIGKRFPDGISAASLASSNRADVSSQMKIHLDFEPREKIKIILYR